MFQFIANSLMAVICLVVAVKLQSDKEYKLTISHIFSVCTWFSAILNALIALIIWLDSM